MPIRKIKAGLVLTKDVDTFVGEPGYLFYDEDANGDKTLRISDGVTPGGVSFLTAGDSSVSGISQSTLRVAGDDSSAIELDLSGTGETFKIAGTGGITTTVSGDTITIDGSGVAGSGSLTISDDSSTTATITNGQDTLKFAGGTNITTAISGDTLTITGPDLSSYLTDTTLNIVADDSQTIAVNNGGSIQFSGGTNITTSTSSDGTITITAPSTVSSFTNDAGYLDTAQLTIVGDDSTGTSFDASQSPTVRFLGAGNVSVAVSGSNVVITGSGAGGSTTYTQDTAPSSPSDGETWLKTDSGALYIWLEEASGVGQWIETGSAGSTLDVDGVDSIRFAADDSTSTPVRTSETLSILGGQGISTAVTGTGEIRISSTGATVVTDDTAPTSPVDGDLWYDTDSGSFYVRVVESGSGNWIEVGTSGGFGPKVFTQDDSPSVSANGDLWYDTDAGALYIRIVESGNAVWVETAGTGQTGGGGITSVAADATPELGGNLDANSYNITNVATLSIATNGNPGTDPATDSGVGYIYAKGTTAELFVKDGAGNITQISPHNEDAEWIYYSENVKTGKRVKVNMEKMIRRLEQITGETFFEIDEPNKLRP